MEALKIWEYKEAHSDQQAKIMLFHDHVEMQNNFYKTPRKFSFNEIFENPYPLGNLRTDYELLKYMVVLIDPSGLNPNARKVFDFYAAFENGSITEDTIEIGSKEGDYVRYYFSLTPFGMKHFYDRPDGIWEISTQRFSSFFFYGPEAPNIPFEKRVLWRKLISESLGNNPPFSLNDAFVLFDYSKIVAKKFEYNNYEQEEGVYLYINPGSVEMGGWKGRDGGGQSYSIEKLWYFDSIVYSELANEKDEIRKILEAALIHGTKHTTHKVLNVPPLKDTNPHEAPPA